MPAKKSPSETHPVVHALLDNAHDDDMRDVIGEMGQDGSLDDDQPDEDTAPADDKAKARVAAWIKQQVQKRVRQELSEG